MCGIVGYIGDRDVYPILIGGLKRLEYRGYDSSGIAILNNGKPVVYKVKGKISDLENFIGTKSKEGTIGIGHTRWATHGEPNDVNAHPHTSMNGKFIIVHNGIIENYATLKQRLIKRGYTFKSETDTEVLANLIEYIYLFGKTSATEAVRFALNKVQGAYGIGVICTDETDKLIVARKSSPLVVGVGDKEFFIGSDATPFIEYTNNVIYLDNDNMAVLTKGEVSIKTIKNDAIEPNIQTVDFD